MAKNYIVYCIDLDSKKPKVQIFSGDNLKNDLEYQGKKHPLELQDWDRKIFMSYEEACQFLEKYNACLEKLKTNILSQAEKLDCIKLPRRYLVQVLMSVKTKTYRKYNKKWKAGKIFNFEDQTFFATCELISIKEEKNLFRYDFKLV